jgi:hypothetical protein
MTVSRSQDRLASFLYSVMLTSVIFAPPVSTVKTAALAAPAGAVKAFATAVSGLRAEGWSVRGVPAAPAAITVSTPAPAPAKTAPASPHVLTPDNLQTLIKIALQKNDVKEYYQAVSDALGLSHGSGPVQNYGIDPKADPSNSMAVLRADHDICVFGRRIGSTIYLYRVDAQLRLITACYGPEDGSSAQPLPIPQAQKDLREILVYWGKYFKK